MKNIKKNKLETRNEFQCRTSGFSQNSLPKQGEFWTNSSLENKVDERGVLKNYAGDTLVFLLHDDAITYAEDIQRILYENCAEMLAERLNRDTFHITLHDLCHGIPSQELRDSMKRSGEQAKRLLWKIRDMDMPKIKVKSTWLFNMVNTSMVLGFEPEDESSCQNLMNLYEIFQDVIYLPYPLTPHITIAYYRPGKYTSEVLRHLHEVISHVNEREKIKVELDVNELVYQHFTNMNHYSIQ